MNSKTKCRLQVSIYRKSSQQDQKKKETLLRKLKIIIKGQKKSLRSVCNERERIVVTSCRTA